MMYKGYVRQRVRKVLAEVDIPLERAIDFLKETQYGVVFDENNNEVTLEELENAKDFGRKDRAGSYNTDASDEQISESSDRELFRTFTDKTKPSSDGDN